MKKYIAQVLVMILVLSSSVHIESSLVSAKSNPLSGKAGKNITWTYDTKTDTMTFKGKGAFYKTKGTSDTPGYVGSWGVWTDDVEHVVIGEGITVIARESFANTSALKDVKLPSTLTKIGHAAFYSSNLSKINFPKKLKVIGSFAFNDCKKLKQIKLSMGLKKLGEFAFNGTNIKKINVPNSVTYIGNSAFSCDKLKEIKLSKYLNYLGNYVFVGSQLKKIVIPKNIDTLKAGMFCECRFLKEIQLSENIKAIEHEAFAETGIESIIIPENVTTLGYGEDKSATAGLFYGCNNLKLVEFRSLKIVDVYKKTFIDTPKGVVFRVPQGKLEEYTKLFREGGLSEDIVIEESTEW